VGQSIRPFEEVNVLDLIETAKIKLDRVIREGNVKIVVHKELPRLKGDRHLLQLVFDTLIDMAIKYPGSGSKRPRIEIGYKNQVESGTFFIQNNNANTRKEHLENIFDLYRCIEERPGEEKGSSPGLAIAKKIIEIHNGQIWFESEEGKGCSFYFSLPT